MAPLAAPFHQTPPAPPSAGNPRRSWSCLDGELAQSCRQATPGPSVLESVLCPLMSCEETRA